MKVPSLFSQIVLLSSSSGTRNECKTPKKQIRVLAKGGLRISHSLP
jgi:hypothetical protein